LSPDQHATDDAPEFELTKMLVEAAARIKSNRHHPNSMGVQFVQIGSDPAAAQSLPLLLQANTGVSHCIYVRRCLVQLTVIQM
jgi:hypothetical protein